ncbi:MAG: M48 family metallopeptidase [Nitrospinae bacterium]|nr:M48 family metallopeptidase [Nitrospinota bacterium]
MVTRKLQFDGALFDGQSAQKHLVHVELTPHHINLKVSDRPALVWPYSNIRWTAVTAPFQIENLIDSPEGQRLETLVIEDPDFYETCQRIAPKEFSNTAMKNSFNWKIFSAGILVLLLFLYGAFKIIPGYIVDQFVDKIPVEWEEALGDAVLSSFPVEKNPDPKVIALLTDILRLLKQSMPEDTPYNLKVYVLPTQKINALALPGGNIIIFEGLLKIADSPEELAGVLAHEVQHVFLKHSTQGILRNLASGIILGLIMGDANAVMDGATTLASQLNSLGLSRKMETEADIKGVELMLKAKINPQGMLNIFEKLLKKEMKIAEKLKNNSSSQKANNILSYLSTHPSARGRLKKLEKLVSQNKNKFWIPLYPNSNWNEIKPRDK